MPEAPTRATLTVPVAQTLAGDLIRQLAPDIADEDAINATMLRWVDVIGPHDFGLVCMAAMHMTFIDCLIPTPIAEAPAGSFAFTAENAG